MKHNLHYTQNDVKPYSASHALDMREALCGIKRMGKKLAAAPIPNRINEIRKRRGITFEELERLTGFNNGYLSRIARAKVNVSLANLQILATALRCEIKDLLPEGAETPNDTEIVMGLWSKIPLTRRQLALNMLRQFGKPDAEQEPVDDGGEAGEQPLPLRTEKDKPGRRP